VNLPPYLKRRQGVRTIDRSRWCRHDDLQEQAACNVCHGTGIRPAPVLSDEAKALGVSRWRRTIPGSLTSRSSRG